MKALVFVMLLVVAVCSYGIVGGAAAEESAEVQPPPLPTPPSEFTLESIISSDHSIRMPQNSLRLAAYNRLAAVAAVQADCPFPALEDDPATGFSMGTTVIHGSVLCTTQAGWEHAVRRLHAAGQCGVELYSLRFHARWEREADVATGIPTVDAFYNADPHAGKLTSHLDQDACLYAIITGDVTEYLDLMGRAELYHPLKMVLTPQQRVKRDTEATDSDAKAAAAATVQAVDTDAKAAPQPYKSAMERFDEGDPKCRCGASHCGKNWCTADYQCKCDD